MVKPEKLMRALEIKADQYYFYKKLLPSDYDESLLKQGTVDYFKRYGFKVPQYIPDIYEKYNGIKSDKYLSVGLYNYTISPYLMNLNLIQAYDDKNIYSMLFPDIKQPKTIIKNMNGRFYKDSNEFCVGEEVTQEEAIEIVKTKAQFLCKSSGETGGGRSVKVYKGHEMQTYDVLNMLNLFKQDFIIQELVKNHPEMSRLNQTSLNTCRVVTYRRVNSSEYIVLGSLVRFGSAGSYVDNASSGGGFCKINPDGTAEDAIRCCKHFENRSLKKDKNIDYFKIPFFSKMKSTAIKLHQRLPYCDIIGWDFAVTDNDDIVLVEYNYRPDLEAFQVSQGPLFGEYTDELMECLVHHKIEQVTAIKRSFDGMCKRNEHIFDLTEMDKL